jgi:diguanylate cyclase (GGDEF)-like protein/PAS domain S-box-containing protein
MKHDTLKVLLIEDDEDDYVLTSELLSDVKGAEYEITWVPKYADGLAAILAEHHDVCLIDYRLGEGTGIELLREAIAAGCRVPMILLTGQGDKETDIEATESGAADYLVKGAIESATLERAIRYAMAHGQTLETLRESETRFRSVVESANDAIILMDGRGQIISWNRAAQTIFGYSEDEILHRFVSVLFPASYSIHLSQNGDCDPLISSGLLHPGSFTTELNGLKKDGAEFPLEISLSSWETAEGCFYSGIVRDVTERKSLEDQLTHQALHDPLTKLANRVLFRDRVEHALVRAKRKNARVAVLFLDLDNFKSVNDSLGHAAGDELLVSVTERLQACLRSSDTPARFGGDEFAVLVEEIDHTEGAVFIAERIRSVLAAPFSISGKDIFVGISIGIATTVTAEESPEELLRNADVAMYMSKSKGKDRYTVFESEMHEAITKRLRLEDDMRAAIDRQEFEVFYQPIVDLQSERIMGMEALVRWNHPVHGLIPPLDFIPVAEETGMIVPLGSWILEQACMQTREWQMLHENGERLSITVNISGRQFQEDALLQTVATALTKSGLPPQSLVLEITESTMLMNTEATIQQLTELKRLGIRLAIDDFGTGYSSLSYLQRFPVDILKIDKSFIDKVAHGKEGSAVARAIITMSGTLHLKTIAEGIESLGQSTELQNLGCELGQGFHFAKPLQADEMGEFLRLPSTPGNDIWKKSHLVPVKIGGDSAVLVIG